MISRSNKEDHTQEIRTKFGYGDQWLIGNS